jgi:hypothetical protein
MFCMFQYRVNMASPQPSAQLSAAADVLHYFELINKQKVCKECTHDSDRECTTLGGIKTRQTLEYRERARAEGQSAPATPAVGTGETPQYMSLAHQYGYDDDMNFGGSNDAEQTVDHQEYQAYVTTPLSSNQIDTLKFWEVNADTFPTIFAMAMDYLPIQASAVPCERVFSSSAETNTMPSYILAHQDDDVDFGDGPDETKQIVDPEYQAYITAPLSSEQVNGNTFPIISMGNIGGKLDAVVCPQ